MHSSSIIFLLFIVVIPTLCKKENILLILVDDLGNSDASFNYNITHPNKHINEAPIPTPHIDDLAHSGIIFSNHYTHWFCGPSRSALLTGRYSVNLGNPFDIPFNEGGGMDPFIPTFAHELQKRNYRNSFIGKWGIDSDGRRYSFIWPWRQWIPSLSVVYPNNKYNNHGLGPLGRGFDNFYGLYNPEHDHFRKRFLLMSDWHIFNETHMIEPPDIDIEIHLSSTHIFVRETITKMHDYINTASPYYKQPFFIHLSFTMPHDPLQVDEKYIINSPKCNKILNTQRRVYCGMVQCVDEGIKNITDFMTKHNLLENTIILFTSDNGGTANFGGFNYPYRGGKASSWNGGVKTPAFMFARNVFKNTSGSVYDGYIHLVDYGPTLLSIIDGNEELRHDMGADIDGMDLSMSLQHFNDEHGIYNVRRDIIVEHNGWANMSAYIDGDYKLLLGHTGVDKVYMEPNGVWTVHDDNATWINTMQQVFNYVIESILPIDVCSGMEWCFMFHTQSLRLCWFDDEYGQDFEHENIIYVHPNGRNNEPQPLYIPYLNWNDVDSVKNIRLYNIKDDPFESDNIALENREKVQELYEKLVDKLIKGAKSKWSTDKSYIFHSGNYVAFCIAMSCIVGFLFIVVFITWCLCNEFCRCGDAKKRKTD